MAAHAHDTVSEAVDARGVGQQRTRFLDVCIHIASGGLAQVVAVKSAAASSITAALGRPFDGRQGELEQELLKDDVGFD